MSEIRVGVFVGRTLTAEWATEGYSPAPILRLKARRHASRMKDWLFATACRERFPSPLSCRQSDPFGGKIGAGSPNFAAPLTRRRNWDFPVVPIWFEKSSEAQISRLPDRESSTFFTRAARKSRIVGLLRQSARRAWPNRPSLGGRSAPPSSFW